MAGLYFGGLATTPSEPSPVEYDIRSGTVQGLIEGFN